VEHWLNLGMIEIEQLPALARRAEELGFTGVTFADHLLVPDQISSAYPYSPDGRVVWPDATPWPDCWVTIGALAMVTTTLRLSTSIYVAPLRDPVSLAKSVGTAATFAQGRLSCGFGAGWMREEFDAVGIDFASRGARFDEMLDVLPRLWSGERVDHHGTHVDLSGVRMLPAAGRIPILVGGNSGPAIARAARADGWIGAHGTVDETVELVRRVRASRAMSARAMEPFSVMLTVTPRALRDVSSLADAGVDSVIVPVLALSRGESLAERLDGVERLAASLPGPARS
jgi:probable F420-dependent oxidoreductase